MIFRVAVVVGIVTTWINGSQHHGFRYHRAILCRPIKKGFRYTGHHTLLRRPHRLVLGVSYQANYVFYQSRFPRRTIAGNTRCHTNFTGRLTPLHRRLNDHNFTINTHCTRRAWVIEKFVMGTTHRYEWALIRLTRVSSQCTIRFASFAVNHLVFHLYGGNDRALHCHLQSVSAPIHLVACCDCGRVTHHDRATIRYRLSRYSQEYI